MTGVEAAGVAEARRCCHARGRSPSAEPKPTAAGLTSIMEGSMKALSCPPWHRRRSALADIRREDARAAARLRRRAVDVLRRLERFPESGRTLPELPDLPHREVIVVPYRFFCRVEGEVVWVVAVWHGAQIPRGPGG